MSELQIALSVLGVLIAAFLAFWKILDDAKKSIQQEVVKVELALKDEMFRLDKKVDERHEVNQAASAEKHKEILEIKEALVGTMSRPGGILAEVNSHKARLDNLTLQMNNFSLNYNNTNKTGGLRNEEQ